MSDWEGKVNTELEWPQFLHYNKSPMMQDDNDAGTVYRESNAETDMDNKSDMRIQQSAIQGNDWRRWKYVCDVSGKRPTYHKLMFYIPH